MKYTNLPISIKKFIISLTPWPTMNHFWELESADEHPLMWHLQHFSSSVIFFNPQTFRHIKSARQHALAVTERIVESKNVDRILAKVMCLQSHNFSCQFFSSTIRDVKKTKDNITSKLTTNSKTNVRASLVWIMSWSVTMLACFRPFNSDATTNNNNYNNITKYVTDWFSEIQAHF